MTHPVAEEVLGLISSLGSLFDEDEDLGSPIARYTLHRAELNRVEIIRAGLAALESRGELGTIAVIGRELSEYGCSIARNALEQSVLHTPVGYITY